jgi:AmmeMemoRadiSam system protein B
MLDQIAAFSPEGVIQAEMEGRGFACGAAPVASILHAAKALGADSVEVVHYSHSGEETGDASSVVGYGAAVVLKQQ